MSTLIRFSPNGQNRTLEVVRTLLRAPDDCTLYFEEGVYDFYSEGAYRGYFFPCCNRNGEKQVIFPLLNLKNITIDGNGARFLFHDRVFPFVLQNCENAVLRGFSVDFTFPRCLEAEVTEMNEEGFGLRMRNGSCRVNQYGNLLIRAGKEAFSSSERRFFLEQRDWHCFLAAGDIYFDTANAPADVIFCDAEQREDDFWFRYREGSARVQFTGHKRLMVSYDELRENDVFFLERCRDTTLQEVHILHAAGMGVVGQCCHGLRLDRYVVDPMDDGLSATTADAILLTNFTGKVTIEHCRVDRAVDDAISIHGFYTRIERITDRNKAVARLIHPSQAGTSLYYKGDLLKVSDGETMQEYGTVTVKDALIREDPALILLELEEDLTGKLKVGDFLENNGRTPEVEIIGCEFQNFPAIRLSSGKKMVFRDNVVKNCNGVLINDLMQYWYVSGCVQNLTVQDNRFENMNVGLHIFIDRPGEPNIRHRNITVEGNLFRNCGRGILADYVDGLVIRGNRFEQVPEPMELTHCTGVCCEDNEVLA